MVAPIVDEETTLLSLQNGVIKDLILKARFGDKAVMGGVGYVATAITRPDVSGQTGSLQKITIREYDGAHSQRLHALGIEFASQGIEAHRLFATGSIRRSAGREST